jgi:hypothetical protein
VLEGKQVPARHAQLGETRPAHRPQAHAPQDVGIRAADEARRHLERSQVPAHVVRNGAVDEVLDLRIDEQAKAPRRAGEPVAHVMLEAFVGEVPEELLRLEVRLRLLARGPDTAPLARHAGRGDAVDDAQALHHAERAAPEGADHRRIQEHDGAKQRGAAHRGKKVEIGAERVPDAEHRLAAVVALQDVDQLRDEVRPALGRRVAGIGADRLDGADAKVPSQRREHRLIARRGKAVGMREMQYGLRPPARFGQT